VDYRDKSPSIKLNLCMVMMYHPIAP